MIPAVFQPPTGLSHSALLIREEAVEAEDEIVYVTRPVFHSHFKNSSIAVIVAAFIAFIIYLFWYFITHT